MSKTKLLRVNQHLEEEYGPLRNGDVIEVGGWTLNVTKAHLSIKENALEPLMVSECQPDNQTPLADRVSVGDSESAELAEGESFSRRQAWMEGALEHADMLLDDRRFRERLSSM